MQAKRDEKERIAMIVGKQKPFEEIWEMIKSFKKVLVFGCNTCVAICHAGGGKEAEILASLIRMKAAQEDISMEVKHAAIERQCEPEFFEHVADELRASDVVLSLACGVGVNFLSDRTGDTPAYPGINTEFFGAVEKAGIFKELCAGCGGCILHLTGGICPVARCAKSIMNGPCGGTSDGKCEISQDVDCAWYLIVERMKKLGTLEKLSEIMLPKDWSTGLYGGPRRVVLEHIAEEGKES
ncbi:MAG TPA: methylenetetrahydrofolate reductase C-terminal domain-containing protein [Thermodesulfovibrionales bacterium]|jgi:ferredoxin|nr:methylenetetrahydrofolate reductase C-terminal domain-containing protein [Thermodesulfovibrionales bacterium]